MLSLRIHHRFFQPCRGGRGESNREATFCMDKNARTLTLASFPHSHPAFCCLQTSGKRASLKNHESLWYIMLSPMSIMSMLYSYRITIPITCRTLVHTSKSAPTHPHTHPHTTHTQTHTPHTQTHTTQTHKHTPHTHTHTPHTHKHTNTHHTHTQTYTHTHTHQKNKHKLDLHVDYSYGILISSFLLQNKFYQL